MKAYFQRYKQGYSSSVSFYTAYEGFLQMGFEMKFVDEVSEIPFAESDFVLVGSVSFMQIALDYFGKDYPKFLTILLNWKNISVGKSKSRPSTKLMLTRIYGMFL